jgi:Putative Actinobacterial Holin-X, holin superfamily III
MTEHETSELGKAIQEVSEKAALLVHEEIELAKAEVLLKLKSLARGAAIGAAAGVFILAGLVYFLHFVALALADLLGVNPWVGYLIVSGTLFIAAAISAFVAARLFKKGSPPTPQLAIEEAQLIKQTIQHAEGSAR